MTKIGYVGYRDAELIEALQKHGDEVIWTEDRIDPEWIRRHSIKFLISFGYRYLIKKDVLDLLPRRAINIHISILPWNRGADPNIWSFLHDTPKGVTIHLIDEGLDTGDIIFQKEIAFNDSQMTLRRSWEILVEEGKRLLIEHWGKLRGGDFKAIPQPAEGGSKHWAKDKDIWLERMPKKWETTISELKQIQALYQFQSQSKDKN